MQTKKIGTHEFTHSKKSKSWLYWNRKLGFWGEFVASDSCSDAEILAAFEGLVQNRINELSKLFPHAGNHNQN